MLRSDKNRIQMFATVMATLNKNEEHWKAIDAFAESVGTYEALHEAIKTSMGKQLAPTTGTTESKETLRTQLEDELMDVADPLASFAHKTKNHDLAAQVECTLASVAKLDSVRATDLAKRVLKLGQTHATELVKFGLGPQDLAELENTIVKYEEVDTKPREAVAGRAAQTKALPALVRAATETLRNDLDRQMTRFRRRQPEFYAAYRNARVIVDSGMNTGARSAEPAQEAATAGLPA